MYKTVVFLVMLFFFSLTYAVRKPGERVVTNVLGAMSAVRKCKKSVQCIKCFGLTYRISTTVLLLRLHLKLLDAGVRSTRSPLYCVSVEIFVATRSVRIMCKFSVFVAGKN